MDVSKRFPFKCLSQSLARAHTNSYKLLSTNKNGAFQKSKLLRPHLITILFYSKWDLSDSMTVEMRTKLIEFIISSILINWGFLLPGGWGSCTVDVLKNS